MFCCGKHLQSYPSAHIGILCSSPHRRMRTVSPSRCSNGTRPPFGTHFFSRPSLTTALPPSRCSSWRWPPSLARFSRPGGAAAGDGSLPSPASLARFHHATAPASLPRSRQAGAAAGGDGEGEGARARAADQVAGGRAVGGARAGDACKQVRLLLLLPLPPQSKLSGAGCCCCQHRQGANTNHHRQSCQMLAASAAARQMAWNPRRR